MPGYIPSPETTRQYQRYSNSRIDRGRGLDVGAVWDLGQGLDNYAGKVWVQPIIFQPFIAPITCGTATDETLILPPMCCRTKRNFNHVDMQGWLWHVRASGAGTVTWRLYAQRKFYKGPYILDKSKLSTDYVCLEWETDSDTGKLERQICSIYGLSEFIFPLLTYQSDGSTTATIKQLSAFYY